jgi:regulator of sigma E protease
MQATLDLIISILRFVIALGILVFLHELGHYAFAKLFKIQVEEFGFGFPPRLVKMFRIGETDFTLNWIPFGAFVRPKGENDPNIPGGMASAPAWQRFFILIGGPLFNIITAIILFSAVFSYTGAPVRDTVSIVSVTADSPAGTAGLKAGDVIVSAQAVTITDGDQLKRVISANLGKEIELVYSRDSKNTTVKLTPRANPPQGQGAVGIVMSSPLAPVTFFQAIPYASYEVYYQAKTLVMMPGMLLRGEISGEQARVVGPIGMKTLFDSANKQDQAIQAEKPQSIPIAQLGLMGIISAALGITNLLPFPALDGGRIIFVLPEILFRKRVPAEMENTVHMVGFAILLILMVVITGQDIFHLIQGQ